MSLLCRAHFRANSKPLRKPTGFLSQSRRWMGSNADVVEEGDSVMLRARDAVSDQRAQIFIARIERTKSKNTHRGTIALSQVIGRRVRDIVKSNLGAEYLITFPTLAEYIVNSTRKVTPIYPADAAAIVNTLDLHVSPELDPIHGPLEILEAGTGHGSLTMHLARAIHIGYAGKKENPTAILHSVEKDKDVHKLAQKTLNGFRRGLYSGSGVQFYRSDVEGWLRQQLSLRRRGVTAHEILATRAAGQKLDSIIPGQGTGTSESLSLYSDATSQEEDMAYVLLKADATSREKDVASVSPKNDATSQEQDIASASSNSDTTGQEQEMASVSLNSDATSQEQDAVSTSVTELTAKENVAPADTISNAKQSNIDNTSNKSEEVPDYAPFLAACVLDMPDPRPVLPLLQQTLHPNAIIGYWAPSITQIANAVQFIKLKGLEYYVEKVLEFSSGTPRVWEVRLVKVRNRVRAKLVPEQKTNGDVQISPGSGIQEQDLEGEAKAGESANSAEPLNDTVNPSNFKKRGGVGDWDDFEMTCRPKPFERAVGGGFFLVLRRMGRQGRVDEKSQASPVVTDAEALGVESTTQIPYKEEGAAPITDSLEEIRGETGA